MGSSKKHKEKEKDRDRDKRREKEGRKRERDKHRKREHERSDRRDRERDDDSERKKSRIDDYDDLLEYAMAESRDEEFQGHDYESQSAPTGGGAEVSLSIEGTNKLREKLGLKPLQVGGGATKTEEKKTSLLDDVHVPAINIGDKEQQEKMRRKLEEIREKRRVYKKLEKVKGLGEEDSGDDSAAAWVSKNRHKDKERKMAEKRAQVLAEMDEEFGIEDLIEEEFGRRRPETARLSYSSKDLRGLKVEHAETTFQEGETTVMTLRDSSVLDEEGDTLYNINTAEMEKANKNMELRKKNPSYRPYDDGEYDDTGMFKARGVLEKYDEEIEGEKKKSFVLETGGKYDTTKEDDLQRIQAKLRNEMVSLEMNKPQIAAEYYSQEEMVKFKKPKKRRKVRKREPLKADDLEAIAGSYMESSDHGSRTLKSILKSSQKTDDENGYDVMDMDIAPLEVDYEGEYYNQEIEEKDIVLEDDAAQLELEIALQRSRRLKKQKQVIGAEKVAQALSAVPKQESNEDEIGSIVIDSTSEFCRTLGEIPTYGSSGNREDEEEEDAEWQMDVVKENEEPQGGWEWVKAQEEKKKQDEHREEETNVLDDEPVIGVGMAAALLLASKKGLLNTSGKRRVETFVADLPSVGIIDEDKMRGDDKDRMRSGRYGGGSYGSSRGEKEGYKPQIKLEYVDDHGRILSQKEAFRFLSHKFHGKTPAKMKTEKRAKKVQEEMAMQKMSSIDTPLNTAALLKEKQRESQSPYLILSGGGKTFYTGTSLAKGKPK